MQLNEGQSQLSGTLRVSALRMRGQSFRRFRRWPIIPGGILLMLFVMGTFAPLISPQSPTAVTLRDRLAPPVWQEGGTSKYILGADKNGRDVLSRIIHGARVSLVIAGSAITLGMFFGTGYGLISGYFGGWLDEVMMRFLEIFLAIPLIMAALAIILVFGSGYVTVIGVLVMFSWVPFARQVRSETLNLKTSDYVALAHVAGASAPRILLRHILPGVVNTVVVVATLNVGHLILTESVLGFLGVGLPPPTPAWGAMTANGRDYLASAWWISFFPGMAIAVTVMGFNFFGDWLRDTLDPRLRQVG
jgi:peptide/nickel transport system permease protein